MIQTVKSSWSPVKGTRFFRDQYSIPIYTKKLVVDTPYGQYVCLGQTMGLWQEEWIVTEVRKEN